jgi:hypothetical protein
VDNRAAGSLPDSTRSAPAGTVRGRWSAPSPPPTRWRA